jgi:Xaa-Pro aminopeptidase
MKKSGVSAYLITEHVDTFYMTGFTGEDSAVLIQPRAVHVLTDRRFEEAAAKEVSWANIHMRKGVLTDEIANVCGKLKLTSLAVQPDRLSLADHDAIRRKTKGVKIAQAPTLTNDLRRRKDKDEIKQMSKALRLAQDAFLATRETIQPGQTEQEIAGRLEYEMRRRGATGPSFPTIAAIDANASNPHAQCGKRKIKSRSALLIDWGARLNFYCSDLTRMLFIGKPKSKIAEIYKITLESQLAAIEAVAPGKRVCDIDDVARSVIRKAGYGDQFSHGLGHGLGLEVHEAPPVSWRSKEELRPGMVVTIEPGIYLPGVGGVRIEDVVLVTERGRRVLSDLPKTIDSAMV